MHNSAAACAASIGGAAAAAHTAIFSVVMLCFTVGDVGSSLTQAYLPPFAAANDAPPPDDEDEPARRRLSLRRLRRGRRRTAPTFDAVAAAPTIGRMLASAGLISAAVVGISSAIIGGAGAYAIASEPSVVAEMRKVLPLVAGTLALHASAVTIEGLLLARRDFSSLNNIYAAVAASLVGLYTLVRRTGAGLAGVWSTYIFFQLSRVMLFGWRAELWRPKILRLLWRQAGAAKAVEAAPMPAEPPAIGVAPSG